MIGDPPVSASHRDPARATLITGGAGFIGANLAHRLLAARRPVILLDDLSRKGVARNLEWLRQLHRDQVRFVHADIRDVDAVARAVSGASQIYHFAAQVAVTTSLTDPRSDFEVNASGTLNILEAIRQQKRAIPLVYTSTNKVYGRLAHIPLCLAGDRYEPEDEEIRRHGLSESQPLDFHSPYGCSKGAADQYVLDFARSYLLPAAVFRMSCVYGPRQFGTEDQGWVAHFLLQGLREDAITIYGDGRQVRDILFVGDLVDALLLAQQHMPRIRGQAFNMGGGPSNTVSLLKLIELIADLDGRSPEASFQPWRVGDQKYYVSDTRRFSEATGWKARTPVHQGVQRLRQWLLESGEVARAFPPEATLQQAQPVNGAPPRGLADRPNGAPAALSRGCLDKAAQRVARR
jgi:CDP-paratose 2-epimerase